MSDNCVAKLTKGEKQKLCGKIPSKSSKLKDDEWMKKLKCLDDIHSHENGLTQQALECLMCKVEMQLEPVQKVACPTERLLLCLTTQENCAIKCKQLMEEFIDCIDTYRINAIKARVEEEKEAAQKEINAKKGLEKPQINLSL
ncbi:hypothetical protein NQ318_008864 [Aromia moschata]|uniref:Uncharacterized protein n=1 Tax=Aromia moschata TaxID=1265417 RepID=A0AAV8ZCU5_9CUCU|nr:hypothetical protein NQ318_008864 [Aromia moschata]